MVELFFLPSVYAPCPTCHGARYNAKTLEIKYRDKNIAEVLGMTVDAAFEFFVDEPHVRRALEVVRQVGLGYLRLGQPATELSGGEAQRVKLATELQRVQRGKTLCILDEPTTGLHPADVEAAGDAARWPGRVGQQRHRGGARDAHRGRQRLGHRYRSRRW
jgi:excinuclease ABC subunit A